MAHSSCSNSIDSLRYERVNCSECGRKSFVLISNFVKNLERLYYGCSVHGWLKWVKSATVETEVDFQLMRRRLVTKRRESGASTDAEIVRNVGCNCKRFLWAIVIINLVLLAAIFGLLIWLIIKG